MSRLLWAGAVGKHQRHASAVFQDEAEHMKAQVSDSVIHQPRRCGCFLECHQTSLKYNGGNSFGCSGQDRGHIGRANPGPVITIHPINTPTGTTSRCPSVRT